MARRVFGRREQIWVAVGSFIALFGVVLALIPGVTMPLWWRIMSAGILCAVSCLVIFDLLLRRDVARRDSAIQILNRITAGDVSLSGEEILRATHSARTAAALRGLVSSLERTIRRFGQLASDVGRVSDLMNARARVLAGAASEQLQSTEATAASVAQIDQSINAVRDSMQELSRNAEETSAAILEMSASIEEASKISDTLANFVEETATAIQQMSASISQVATNTENFSSFATQTASSIVEMNATSAEIGRSAQRSSQLAGDVKAAAEEGRGAVEKTADGMRRIEQAVREAQSALADLAERSKEIGEIIRVIDDIARQTNLLALNAAIIAAQAGDRGKGFAVVAEEIRDLSERTSASTDQIRTLIGNVQRGVSRATEQMSISSGRVQDGVGLTGQAVDVLENILELTDRSTNSISEIARATEEQARGSAATTKAIEEVTKMVQQTAVATQEQSQTALKVGEQAAVVRDYTKHLKRATSEQQGGSRSIATAMQNIAGLVQKVLEATSVLAAESAAIVKSMDVVQTGSREATFGVSDLNQMSGALSHEAALLRQEIGRFALPAPREGGRLVTSTTLWQPVTFDPIYTTAAALGFMSKAVHARLVTYGEGAELRADLAERWEVLDQGLRYRFHLRRGARFHNGREVEAKDVHDSFLRLLLPENKSSSSWIARTIAGAEAVVSGEKRTLEGIVAQDRHVVDIQLQAPLAFFLSLLSMHECAIVPAEETRDPEKFRLRAPGAGPFRVEEVVEGKLVRLARNRDYFLPGLPLLDELVFRLDLDSTRHVAEAFLRGELDIAHGIPLSMVRELRDDPHYTPYLLGTVQLHTSYLGYDSSSPPFDRQEVRKAVALAINRQRINEEVFGGMAIPAAGLLPPGLLGFDQRLRGNDYDPDRARSLMQKSGFAEGFEVEYRTWETDEFRNSGMIRLIVEDLQAIGIRVRVSEHAVSDARRPLAKAGHGNIFCGNWYADFPDSDNFFFVFFHSQSSAVAGLNFHSAQLDADIEQARQSNDPDERVSIYRALNEQVVRDAPLVPLFHERLFVLHKPNVRAVRTSLVTPPVRYHDVWIESEEAEG